ncbi:thioredoxin domain-containing protein [Streptomyces sp. NPDC012693]|uniref:thioredoxin domain-containing protein n=1 Tax=Streptomyces sp. NPDC012693 TaxID=3364844 RepID=UPI0036AE1E39
MRTVRAAQAALAVGLAGGVLAACGPRGAAADDAEAEGLRFEKIRYASVEWLPERLAADGTTIEVGDPEVTTTLHVYEDPRCPVVEEYETTGAEGIEKPLLLRQTRARYTFATFKDERLGGDGSKRAVNALRAALEQQKFVEYHRVLFDNQATVEASGGFTTDRLLKLAAQVPGLRGEAFDSAVRTMKYRAFVTASDRAFDKAGENISDWGTPSLLVDGHRLEGGLYGVAFEADLLGMMVTDLHRRPWRWESYYVPLGEMLDAKREAEEAAQS